MFLPHVRFQVLTAARMKVTAFLERLVGSLKYTDVSDVRTASIIRVIRDYHPDDGSNITF
jgi:hypothetical protein